MSRFPFPMPFGWFKVAMPDEVGPEAIVTKRYFGTELVVWRTADGDLVCQEAYCGHLGAHLGVGGKVEGDCIRCPFHGWTWDGDGNCASVPYSDKVNRKARVRPYPLVERNGRLVLDLPGLHPVVDGALDLATRGRNLANRRARTRA